MFKGYTGRKQTDKEKMWEIHKTENNDAEYADFRNNINALSMLMWQETLLNLYHFTHV